MTLQKQDLVYLSLVLLFLAVSYGLGALFRKNVEHTPGKYGMVSALVPFAGSALSVLLVAAMELSLLTSSLSQYQVNELVLIVGRLIPIIWFLFALFFTAADSLIVSWIGSLVSVAWVSLGRLGFGKELKPYIDEFTLPLGDTTITLYQILTSVSIFLLTGLVLNFALRLWLDKKLVGVSERKKTSTRRKVSLAVYLVITVVMVNVLGFDSTFLSFLTGGLGIGVGFALKQIASNFISGRVAYFQTLLKKGDMCGFEDGSRAIVQGISTTHVKMLSLMGEAILIPCEELMAQKLRVWRNGRDYLMVAMEFGLTYGSNIEKAMGIVLREGPKNCPSILREPGPKVTIAKTGDSSVLVRLVYYMDDFPQGTWTSKSEVYRNVIRAFQPENDIHFAYPTQTLLVESLPETGGKAH